MTTHIYTAGTSRSTPSLPHLDDTRALASYLLELAVTTTKWIVRRRGFHFDAMGLSIRDVATDAVAELLVEDGSGECTPIRGFLEHEVAESDDDTLIEAHVRAIVVRTINQNITRILAEYDPVYAKSLRMLRIHVKRSAGVSMKRAISGDWYFRGTVADASFHLPALPINDLRTRFSVQRMNENPSVSVLEACLDSLADQDDYRKAVHESDVMRLTLELLGSDLESVTHDGEMLVHDHDQKLLFESLESAVTSTRAWASEKYVRKSKLSCDELEAMIGAIKMYLLDVADGEPESHYYYLRHHLAGLSYERFRADYRNTFQYILKQFFTNARGLLLSLGYERMESHVDTMGE
jgi:hypothetical protein